MKRYLDHPLVAWLMTLLWVGLVFYLLLMPGTNVVVADTSDLFGGTNLTDALGHVVLFVVLTGLVYRVLACYLSRSKAFYATIGVILILGTCVELAQYLVPERGVAVLDLSANWLGALIFVGYKRRLATAAGTAPDRPDK
jgi:VanZ family protein